MLVPRWPLGQRGRQNGLGLRRRPRGEGRRSLSRNNMVSMRARLRREEKPPDLRDAHQRRKMQHTEREVAAMVSLLRERAARLRLKPRDGCAYLDSPSVSSRS